MRSSYEYMNYLQVVQVFVRTPNLLNVDETISEGRIKDAVNDVAQVFLMAYGAN